MRSAILLSGNPRFCKDFNLQLNILQDYNIDWFVTMWTRYHTDDTRISPNWNGNTTKELLDWIQPHLPPKHTIQYIELLDHSRAPIPDKTYKEFYANSTNLLQQFWILDYCDQQRRNSGLQYDLIIRSRPDIAILNPLNLNYIHNYLLKSPNTLILPRNERRGAPIPFCDQFAIALPDTMTLYTQTYKSFDNLYNKGVPYNPEYLMANACLELKLNWPMTDFDIGLRTHGYHVPGHFHPDFDNWL